LIRPRPRGRFACWVALALALVVVWPRLGRTEPSPGSSVAIIEMSFASATPAAVRTQVAARLRGALGRAGSDVLAAARVAGTLKAKPLPVGCRARPCLTKVARDLGARRLLIAGVGAVGSSYDILLSVFDGASGVLLAQVSRLCDVCTFAEVGMAVDAATAELQLQAARSISNHGRLEVVAAGQKDAQVWLDGVGIGRAPQQRLLAPGWHVVAIQAGGRVLANRRVWLLAGKRLRVSTRDAISQAAPLVRRRPRARAGPVGWPAWLTLAAGISAIAAGSVALALDQSCPRGGCSGQRETTALGAALLGAGAAATLGAGLLIHYYRNKRRSDPAALTGVWENVGVTALPGQLGLLYSRRF